MKVKVIIAAVLAALIFAGGFLSCSRRKSGGLTIEEGVLTIGMEIGYPPMEYYDDDAKTPIGFDVEMGKALAAKMGLTPKFVNNSWEAIFSGVERGDYDCIMSSVTINPARLAAHNFSRPYVSNTLAMVLLKGSEITARTPQECAGLDVTYQEETTSDYYMTTLAEGGLEFNAREYEKVMNCFDEMELGRVDVIVTDLLVAYDYIAPADSPFEIVWTSDDPEQFGICMKKGNDELTAAIDKALEEIFADGTILRISNEIFGMDLVSDTRR